VLLLAEKARPVKPTFGFAVGVEGVAGVEASLGFGLADLPSFFFLKYSIADALMICHCSD
jgi:hypothetical protein